MSLLPPWLGLAPEPFDPSPVTLPANAAAPHVATSQPFGFRLPGDTLARPWFVAAPGDAGALAGSLAGGGVYALITALVGALQRLAGTMFGPSRQTGGARQHVADAALSSTGDPHLAEHGTLRGGARIDRTVDSMTSHADLLDAPGIAGGYRVSTTVTAPDAAGVTWNRTATVHAGAGADRVTMHADGTLAISDAGRDVDLAAGATLALSGGETVSRNADGSVAVAAGDGAGGTVTTILRATGAGVDVTTHAVDVTVGGDIVSACG